MRFVLVCAFVLMARTVSADPVFWSDTVTDSTCNGACNGKDPDTWIVSGSYGYIGYMDPFVWGWDAKTRAAFRFTNAPWKRGARIDSAKIGLVADSSAGGTGGDTVEWVMYALDSGNCSALTSGAGNAPMPSGSYIDAEMGWQIVEEWISGSRYYNDNLIGSNSIGDIIQPIAERPDWDSGNAFVITFFDEQDSQYPDTAELPQADALRKVRLSGATKFDNTDNPIIEVWYTDAIASLSVHCLWGNYPSAVDSLQVLTQVGATDMGYDSIFFAISDTGYVDSSSHVAAAWPSGDVWLTTTIGGISLTEGQSAYVSAWAWKDTCDHPSYDTTWSERATATTTLTAQLQISGATIQGVTIE